MSDHFVHHFEHRLPTISGDEEWDQFKGMPLIDKVIGEAMGVIGTIEAFAQLPNRNQGVILAMAAKIIRGANNIINSGEDWRQNYWGLYVVGSRARGEAGPDSDVDLLSVGTFYRDLGFCDRFRFDGIGKGPFVGFDIEAPDELPSQYNTGNVDRKYLLRATPRDAGILPVDLSVVDMTFVNADLEEFKTTLDVDEAGVQLARIPLVEVTVVPESDGLVVYYL